MNKLTTALLAGGALLSLSLQPALAGDNWNKDDTGHKGGWKEHHGEKDGHGIDKMKKHLELSDKQVNQLESLFKNKGDQVKPLKSAMHSDRKAIKEMINSGKLDENKLESLAKSIGENKAKMVIIRAKHQVKMMEILNKEQKEKYKNYWSGKRGHGKQYDGKHHSMK